MNVWLTWLAFLGWWLLVSRLSRRFSWQAETSRKMIHTGMGLVCAAFPWIFQIAWHVWLLALLCFLPLMMARYATWLIPVAMSEALHRVSRRSCGELLFAPSVALAFTFGSDNRAVYVASILMLAVADAAGALAGKRWGQHVYETWKTHKSWEGSLAVLVTGSLVAFASLYFLDDLSWQTCLLVSLIAGCLVMMIEAIADSGFDNLTIPVGMALILERLIALDEASLISRLVFLLFLAVMLIFSRRKSTLDGGALLGGCLLLYACHALGGWRFLLPPLTIFLLHVRACCRWNLPATMKHGLGVMTCLAAPIMLWLVMHTRGMVKDEISLTAIAWACSAYLALTLYFTRWHQTGRATICLSSAVAVVTCVAPVWWMSGNFPLRQVVVGSLACLAAVWISSRMPWREGLAEHVQRCVWSTLLSSIVFLPL